MVTNQLSSNLSMNNEPLALRPVFIICMRKHLSNCIHHPLSPLLLLFLPHLPPQHLLHQSVNGQGLAITVTAYQRGSSGSR